MDLIPKEIISSVRCYVVCRDYEDEDCKRSNNPVDVALCNSNGYLLEIFNKKIVNSCYILMDDATKLQIYYKFTEDRCQVYYLAQNSNGVMIIIRKCNNLLMVVTCYRNVKNCKIFDYKKKGYPQIGLSYKNSDKVDIIEVTEIDNVGLSENSFHGKEISMMLNSETSSSQKEDENVLDVNEVFEIGDEIKEKGEEKGDESIIKEYLSKKLKGMENFQNELKYELDNLNLMLKNGLQSEFLSPAALTSSNAAPSGEIINIKSTKTWFRIHNSKWILGIEFWRSGIRNIKDIKVLVRNLHFSCTYQFFEASDTTENMSNRKGARDNVQGTDPECTEMCPDTHLKSIVVFALEIPDFAEKSNLSVGFTFIYRKYQYHTETFYLKPEDLFHKENQIFQDKSEIALSEDILACLVISRIIDITVEIRYNLGLSLEDVLSKNLGFQKAEVLGKNYFIKEGGYLDGTLVSCNKKLDSIIKWKLSVAVRDLPRLKILVKALSNELPLPLRIRIDQDCLTGCRA